MTHLAFSEGAAADLYITEELDQRPVRSVDHLREKQALQELLVKMADAPEEVLPRFVDLAMALTGGSSAGLSLLEPDPAPGVFRWRHLHGSLATFEDALTPRDYSPCGVTLDRNEPVLSLHPERYYSWISDASIVVPEVLLVPLHLRNGRPLGTLWIVSETEQHFHRGHARTLSELAVFLSIALGMIESDRQLKQSLEEQELLAKEMSHRLKNVFAVADGMVRISARSAQSPAEMAGILVWQASCARERTFPRQPDVPDLGQGAKTADLETLIRTVLAPHEANSSSRFILAGEAMPVGDHAANGLALVIHELATNAAKYGALSVDEGQIELAWKAEGEHLVLTWHETGGPPATAPAHAEGFGSTLLRRTLAGQLGGSVSYDWAPDGLRLTLHLALGRLHH